MRRVIKYVSVFLVLVLAFSCVSVQVFAAAAQGRITGEGVALRDKATTQGSTVILRLSKGATVTVNGKTTGNEAVAGGGTTWYDVTYSGKRGYVYGKYVEEITPPAYNADFEKNLLNFPESYRAALRTIHNSYPNWVFVADNIGIGLDSAVNLEYGGDNMFATKKLVELTYGTQWRDARVDEKNPDHLREGGRWTFASREAIAYFMDPRNALTVTNTKSSFPNIFTFLQQSYDSATQNEAGLRTVVAGTFLANGYGGDGDAYIKDIMQAARESNVSPYVIAGTIIVEQGTSGTSGLISGTYAGYEGYYNFFNYGATGDNVILNGLIYAKNKDWNSRRVSIVEGAKLYAEGYINRGQDTYYYMDFNVKGGGIHQYANSLYDQCVKAVSMRKVCITNKDAALTFKIPVYSSVPAAAYAVPTIENYEGGTPAGPEEPTVTPPQTDNRRKGDVNNDGKVTVIDFAAIRMHLLGVKTLNATECSAADINGDKTVNVQDFAMVRMFLLGIITF